MPIIAIPQIPSLEHPTQPCSSVGVANRAAAPLPCAAGGVKTLGAFRGKLVLLRFAGEPKGQAGGIPVRLVQPVTVAPGGFCGGRTTSGGGPKRAVDAGRLVGPGPRSSSRTMHRLLQRSYRDPQLSALRIACPRAAASSVLERESGIWPF